MTATNNTEAFYSFLGEYTTFFGEMEQFEQQKLITMLSGDMPAIEHLLVMSQANAKKLDNLEQRRMQMQQEAGLGTMSMGELVSTADSGHSQALARQLRKLTSSIANIRFYNTKSMALAEDNLRRMTRYSGGEEHTSRARLGGKA